MKLADIAEAQPVPWTLRALAGGGWGELELLEALTLPRPCPVLPGARAPDLWCSPSPTDSLCTKDNLKALLERLNLSLHQHFF